MHSLHYIFDSITITLNLTKETYINTFANITGTIPEEFENVLNMAL